MAKREHHWTRQRRASHSTQRYVELQEVIEDPHSKRTSRHCGILWQLRQPYD